MIYGDIGTSPLYVYSSTFTKQPSYDDLVGALSIIIWSLTLIVTVKYCFIVLRADDDGEGGTFALYSLLARYANIVKGDPNLMGTLKMNRYHTGELKPTAKSVRTFIENSMVARAMLKVIGVLGVSMVMAGMLYLTNILNFRGFLKFRKTPHFSLLLSAYFQTRIEANVV